MILGLKYGRTIFTTSFLIAVIVLAETCVDKSPDHPAAPSTSSAADTSSSSAGPSPSGLSSAGPSPTGPSPSGPEAQPIPSYSEYAGSAKCLSCHKDITHSFAHTAHYLSTQPVPIPGSSSFPILGSFEKGKNVYVYDATHKVVMEKRATGFYQVGYLGDQERVARRIDIVVGSGTKGQTYITRNNNELYQLPVSYFTIARQWANSPLYPRSPILFNRPITSRCLECHSTFVKQLTFSETQPETFDSTKIVYGVSCEKCHGPAARHVDFHTRNPREKIGRFIINPARFSREQSLELCALCHGGRMQKTQPSFTYLPGQPLSAYFIVDSTRPDPDHIDVHGNQYGLLRSSRCFRESSTMTCITCHNPHKNERADLAAFSARCMTCHSPGHGNQCKLTASIGPSISANCIDCHMPLRPSQSITELLPGHNTPTAAMIRSHLIKIYLKNDQH
ncbi:MAG TPA: multiheme c-type cytochrome [Puia sp.]|jgi:hypothetical protein|nr:multiheme c-type cytochrome [Puia sp.]